MAWSPAIVQHAGNGAVLMMGYMNREALAATTATGRVTFWSRSKGRLWTKGETSGSLPRCPQHRRRLRPRHSIDIGGALGTRLPSGHGDLLGTGRAAVRLAQRLAFLSKLEHIIEQRIADPPTGQLYREASGGRRATHCAESR